MPVIDGLPVPEALGQAADGAALVREEYPLITVR